VLCVDEKSQMQALDRSPAGAAAMPGMPSGVVMTMFRNGVTSLFAAFDIADGTVISEIHRRHRAVEFKKFLVTIDKTVPAELTCIWCATTCPLTRNLPSMRGWPSIAVPHALHSHRFVLD